MPAATEWEGRVRGSLSSTGSAWCRHLASTTLRGAAPPGIGRLPPPPPRASLVRTPSCTGLQCASSRAPLLPNAPHQGLRYAHSSQFHHSCWLALLLSQTRVGGGGGGREEAACGSPRMCGLPPDPRCPHLAGKGTGGWLRGLAQEQSRHRGRGSSPGDRGALAAPSSLGPSAPTSTAPHTCTREAGGLRWTLGPVHTYRIS